MQEINGHRWDFLQPLLPKTPDAPYQERWERFCDFTLGRIANAWHKQFYRGINDVRVRCTLYTVMDQRAVPLRRSRGYRQVPGDQATTEWESTEGAAGGVLETGETVYIPNAAAELADAARQHRTPSIAIKTAAHKAIQFILCSPIKYEHTLAGVLCIDSKKALPKKYKREAGIPDHPLVFIIPFVHECATLLRAAPVK